jgi:hypothetical protein
MASVRGEKAVDIIEIMTRLMEQAIERLREVPDSQQDQFARFLLNEMEDDDRWTASTAAHGKELRKLSEQILEGDRQGLCKPVDADNR